MKAMAALMLALCLLAPPGRAGSRPLRISALRGPTAMGLVRLMEESGQDLVFTLAASPDAVVPGLVRGETDAAFLPVSLAAILYANTGGALRAVSVSTLGSLYILGHGPGPESLQDLAGRRIYCSGKASTPEHILTYLLDQRGVAGVETVFKSEHSEALAAFLRETDSLAMLPQPFVTRAAAMAPDVRIAVDLNREWEALTGSLPVTGVAVASAELVNARDGRLERFLKGVQESVSWVNGHPREAAVLIEARGILDRETAEKALPLCGIVHITGREMQSLLVPFYRFLFDRDPASTGGRLPDDAFYYVP